MPEEKDVKKEETLAEEEVSQEEFEKALDTALINMNKADKVPPADEEDEYGEEEEEEEKEKKPLKKKAKKSEDIELEDDEPDFQNLSKSLEETVGEEEDAQEVIEAVPFIKALMDSLETQLTEMVKAIVVVSDKVDDVNERLDKSEKIVVAEAKLIKSVSENLRKIGESPLPRKSVLGEGLQIIEKSETGEEKTITLSKADALNKVTELCKADKITLEEAITAEGRINKGQEVPERIKSLLTA